MHSKYQLLSFNQEFLPVSDFNIGTNNRAFRYGDGFFETMHANGTDVQFLSDHFNRIERAAKLLKINLPEFLTESFLKKQIAGLLTRMKLFQAVRVKLTVYRKGEGLYIPMTDLADVIIEATYLGKGSYELNAEGLTIGIYADMFKPKSVYSSIKAINSQPYILAGIFARDNGFDDVLLLNDEGNIVEATSSNVFVVKGNDILTPSLSYGCVDGIMRKQVIKLAAHLHLNVDADANIKPYDLTNMDEVFLTNAVSGLRYVSGYSKRRYFKRVSQKLVWELNKLAFPNSFLG